MGLWNVFIKDVDGNIPYNSYSGNEKITGLLFDVSLQPTLFTAGYGLNNSTKLKLNDVLYITNRKSSIKDFGIIERVECAEADENTENFMHGIPAYHIREFFRMSPDFLTTLNLTSSYPCRSISRGFLLTLTQLWSIGPTQLSC